jgi:hypothetical protein
MWLQESDRNREARRVLHDPRSAPTNTRSRLCRSYHEFKQTSLKVRDVDLV